MAISDITLKSGWYQVFDDNGKKTIEKSASSVGELQGFTNTFSVFTKNGWTAIYDEKFNKIVEICSLNRLIKSRPFKYDTYLYDGGKELSGGERNLIILARALVSDAKIYVLDETLAELNDSVENNVLNALFNNYKDKTIIYVSHKNKKNYFKRVIYV